MATKRKSNGGTRRSRSTESARTADNAITLLEADHRQVEGWFDQFRKSRSWERKAELATSICGALLVHTRLEEEMFYPAFLEIVGDEQTHHEATIEHSGAKSLIEEIELLGPEDEYFDARVNVLAEMIRHHVQEEEKSDGMFAKARSSTMDLDELGEQLAIRKAELQREFTDGGGRAAPGNAGTRTN
jgi:hemerythrin superfamily protein